MRGTAYAVTEIVAFLIIATLIGIAAGWLLATLRGGGRDRPVPTMGSEDDQALTAQLASATEAIDAGRRLLAAAQAETAELRQELSVAHWQVGALEEELARVRDGGVVR